jgi:hypothetical protein
MFSLPPDSRARLRRPCPPPRTETPPGRHGRGLRPSEWPRRDGRPTLQARARGRAGPQRGDERRERSARPRSRPPHPRRRSPRPRSRRARDQRGTARIGDLGHGLQRSQRRDRGSRPGRRCAAAASPPAQPQTQPRERQQGRDLAGQAGNVEPGFVDAGRPGSAAARLTVGQMPGQLAALAGTQRTYRPLAARGDSRLDLFTPSPADQIGVFSVQAPPGPEQVALHDRLAHPHALADLPVRESFQLAHHHDAVVVLRQPPEGAAEIVQALLVLDRRLGGGGPRDEVLAALS